MKKKVALNNCNYFEIFIGKRVLKSEVFNSKDTIPIYSANVLEPFGFIGESNISDFSVDYVLWGIDGKFEFNIIPRGKRFATTDHCGVIKIKDKNILPEYLLYELELQSHLLGFDRTLRSSLANMENVVVKIPIDKKGGFDVKAQKTIVQKYMALKTIKENLKCEAFEIDKITIDIKLTKTVLMLKIDAIFDLTKSTNGSKFTKAFVHENPGDIPVYSASKIHDEISYGYVKDGLPDVKYFEDILTWNIDGSVGKAFFRSGKFTLSEKVIPLMLKKEWEGLIDYTYIKYVLEKKAVECGFAFSNKAGKNRIGDIEIEIPAVRKNGNLIPDIHKQKELAKEYEEIYAIKDKIVQYLYGLTEISVKI